MVALVEKKNVNWAAILFDDIKEEDRIRMCVLEGLLAFIFEEMICRSYGLSKGFNKCQQEDYF